ncbi:MAG: permease [Candidatus Promineifilaceae bacterium]
MEDIIQIGQSIALAIGHTWPWFLISIVLSVFIRVLKLDKVIRQAFSTRVGWAILIATLVGAFSPFCSCTVVPIIAGLIMSGVPLAPIMAFWIASPSMDPEIFAFSVGLIGWPMAIARLVATLLLSLAAGYITFALTNASSLIDDLSRSLRPRVAVPVSIAPLSLSPPATMMASGNPDSLMAVDVSPLDVRKGSPSQATDRGISWRKELAESFGQIVWPDFVREVGRQSWRLGRWVLLAFLLEALITQYVPQEDIASLLGNDRPLAVPLAALIGVPLYLNNFGALPIVAGLLDQGMQPGAAIAFLIAGPVTTIPAMTAVYGTVNKRIFILYVSIALFGAMIMGALVNLFLS